MAVASFNLRAAHIAVIPLLTTFGFAPVAVAGPGDGIYVNDGIDNGCTRLGDSGSVSGGVNSACLSSDKASQTDHSLFYNPLGQFGLGSTSLTLGNELFVNGGSTTSLAAPVTAGAHINTLDMRGTKILQLADGTVSATSQDAVNGAELFNTATSTAAALGGGAQVISTTGQISVPTYVTTTITAAGNVTTDATSANVADALTSLSTSLANTANVGVNYDDAATKTRVTLNPSGAAATLTNVAVGALSATSTDAVNGSQLNATNTAVNGLGTQINNLTNTTAEGVKYDDVSTKTSVTFNQGGAATTLTNVAAGTLSATSTDAVNGSQLNATNISVSELSTNVNTSVTNLGAQISNLTNTTAEGVKYDDVSTKTSVTFNQGGTATTLTNVAAGTLSTTSTDAVNGSQLNATNTSVSELSTNVNTTVTNLGAQISNLANTTAEGVKYDDVSTKTSVTFNQGGAATTLINVAAGTLSATSTDAVNGSQLNATNTSVADLGTNLNTSITNLGNSFSTQLGNIVTNGTGIKYFHSNSTLGDSVATGIDSVAIGPLASTSADNAIALGNGANASTANSLALGNGASTVAATATANGVINGTTYTYAGIAPVGVLSLGTVGAERQISNVAAGRVSATSTDAVNGSQLNATNTSVSELSTNLNTTVTNLGAQISNLTNTTAEGVKYDDVSTKTSVTFNQGGAATTLTNVAAATLSATSTDAVNGSQLNATNTSVSDLSTNLRTQISNLASVAGTQLGLLGQGFSSALGGGAQVDPVTGAVTAPTFNTTTIDAAGNTTTATTSNNVGNALTSLGNSLANTAAVGVKYDDVNSKTRVTFNQGGAATTLTNVAAATLSATSTDAVNGSQLNATNTSVSDLSTNLRTQISNLASVAGTQLGLLGQGFSSALGGGAQVDPVTAAVTAPSFNTTTIDAAGNTTTATTSTNVGDALTSLSNSLANTATVGVKYDDVSSKTRVTFNQGSAATTLSNVAAGTLNATSTDAVNGSQLFNTTVQLNNLIANSGNQSLYIVNALGGGSQVDPVTGAVTAPSFSTTAIDAAGNTTTATTSANVGDALTGLSNSLANTAAVGVKYDDVNSKTQVTFNPDGAATTLTNVAAGTLSATSTDAVNGSQLFLTNNTVVGLSSQLNSIITSGSGIKYFHASSSKADSLATGTDAIAIGPNAQASGMAAIALGNDAVSTGSSSVAIGDGAKTAAAGSVAIGKGASDDQRGTETYVGKYSNASNTTAGVVSVGNAAAGETRVLSNVADGNQATDAVNVRQLDGAVAESKAYTDTSLNQIQGSIKNVDGAIANVTSSVAKVDAAVTSVQNGTSGAFQVNNTRAAAQPKATGTNAVAGGMGSQASGSNSMAVGNNTVASAENATATGNGAQATAQNSVALGANSVADRENSVSVGTAGGERQITNVAAGTRGTDAANIDQVSRGIMNANINSKAYTDQRFTDLKRNLKQQDDTLSAGIAGAMAMASLPRSSVAGGSMTSVAMSNYRGQSALAIGVSHVSENGRWSTNFMGTTSSQNDTGVALGVGYQW